MRDAVGFIGLGTMGSAMAKRLLECGFHLVVYDINKKALAPFRANPNCHEAQSPGEVGMRANRVITILPTSDQVDEVLFAADGVAGTLCQGGLLIEMTTGRLDQLETQARSLSRSGHRMIDAPVCLSPREAATGQLIALVGGEERDLETARDILNALTSRVIHSGPTGFGLRLKLTNNYMSMINHVLTGEVLALAQAMGLDREVTVDLLQNTAAGRGQLLTNYPKKVLKGDVSPDFSIKMGIKDLEMSAAMFEEIDKTPAFGQLAKTLFREADKAGYGDQDCTAILNFLDQRADLKVTP
ncbi:MAG: NAD(P)-dependent oxidoreductase [Rhodospirillales bacterium]|nr:NAD(P)-dependent oxidoreductase [Rhodospirillales bacterium]